MRTTCLGLMIVCLFAGTFAEGTEFPKAKIQLKIVDQDGDPVENARIFGGFITGTRVNDYAMLEGVTDVGGSYVASGPCNEFLRYEITKEGYYATQEKVSFADTKNHYQIVDGKWQPYGETRMVVLKGIKHPHAMLGPDRTPQRKRTTYDEWLAFDLEKADFLPPIGEGSSQDMLVRYHLEGVMPHDWSLTMEVSFENNPHAGAYRLKKDTWSDMNSSYDADTNATYQTNFTFRYSHRKGEYPSMDMLKEDEYMVFRTRTKVDREGRLVSARYGKIYGPWLFADAGGFKISRVLMNSADNDLNLEDNRILPQTEVLSR